jgi:hypothetical protein
MTIGPDVTPSDPAVIGTVWTGAEMVLGIHRAWTSPYGDHRRQGSGRSLDLLLRPVLTGGARWLTGETWKWPVPWCAPRRPRGDMAGCGVTLSPDPDQAHREPQDAKQQECVEQQVVYHLSFPLHDR